MQIRNNSLSDEGGGKHFEQVAVFLATEASIFSLPIHRIDILRISPQPIKYSLMHF